MEKTLTPAVRRNGTRLYGQVEPVAEYDFMIGRVEVLDGDSHVIDTIDFRAWGRFDARTLDLHVSPDSPRGSVHDQVCHAAARADVRVEIVRS